MTTAHDERAGLLYDFAVEHPDGFVFEDTQEAFGWNYAKFKGR